MKLYSFNYSCYARKVQMLLDLLGVSYDIVEVSYGNRRELAELTNGYIQIPVVIDDQGQILVDSRNICQILLANEKNSFMVPKKLAAPIWAYADWCDGPLEDTFFRLASPRIARQFQSAWEKALFVFVKERKFGQGCVDLWEKQTQVLLEKAQSLLMPTFETLKRKEFIFGIEPTLADVALYGQFAMLRVADSSLLAKISADIEPWMLTLERKSTKNKK